MEELTFEQFQELRKKGLSNEQILNFEQGIIPEKRNIPEEVAGAGMALGGIGLGAYAVVKGVKAFTKPRGELKIIKNELKNIQKELNIEGTEFNRIPEIQRNKITAVKIQIGLGKKILNQNLDNFDNTILKSKTENIAQNIAREYPSWIQKGSNGYSVGLDAINLFMQDKGINLSGYDLGQNFLANVIKNAKAVGVLDEELTQVNNLYQQIGSSGQPVTFKQAKGYYDSLTKSNPNSKLTSVIRENWGNWLTSKELPQEVGQELKLLNDSYKPFANVRNKLDSMGLRKGVYNIRRLTNYLTDYTKGKFYKEAQNVMSVLGEGTPIAEPISGVKQSFQELGTLRTQRARVEQAIPKVEQSLKPQIDKLSQWKEKSENLISKANVLEKQWATRKSIINPLQWPGKILGIGGKFLGVSPIISGAIDYARNPAAYTASMEGGMSQDELIKARERYQSGQMSDEEKIRLGLVL